MRVTSRLTDPRYDFLLGISLADGIATNRDTGEELDVSLLTIGLFFFEIYIVW